ncbi:hypothetical protein [Flavobacterium sp. IMCC34518]|uniref:hypothetical protein n=1 Tax=Flavobacterium sp. IMCC34518 TaxID=3003623 RepID=UPI0022AC6EF4|nr:hypothetical protein [Flavobacterium sp. IMCC34518]
MDLTQEEYEQKRREVIAKFNKQFIENNYSTDAYTHKAVELLTRGVNPYEIIEHLVTANQELLKEFDKLIRNHTQPPIILKEDK